MKKLLLIALLFGATGSVLVASPFCTTMTAAQFQALGNGGCLFGNTTYYGFTYSYTVQDSIGNALPSDVSATAVTVQFSDQGNLPNQPVVSFLSNWDVINGNSGDVRINYTVSAPVSAAMSFSSMTLSGFVSNVDPANQFNSYISGAETVCCPGPASSVVPLGVELDPAGTASGLVFRTGTDGAAYAPATEISFIKDIFLSSGSNSGVAGPPPNGNEATLTRIDEALLQTVNGPVGPASVPEPVSFLLFGSGLISMMLVMKGVRKFNQKGDAR